MDNITTIIIIAIVAVGIWYIYSNYMKKISPAQEQAQGKEGMYFYRPRFGRRMYGGCPYRRSGAGCPYGYPGYLYNWQPYGTYLW